MAGQIRTEQPNCRWRGQEGSAETVRENRARCKVDAGRARGRERAIRRRTDSGPHRSRRRQRGDRTGWRIYG